MAKAVTTKELQAQLATLQQQLAWERASDRILAEVVSMRSSSDLMNVSLKMYHELWRLGIETPACAFFFVNEDQQRIILYVAFPNPRKGGRTWTHPDLVEIDDDTATAKMDVPITDDWEADLDYWRGGDVWHVSRSYEEDAAVLQSFIEYFGLSGPQEAMGPPWITNNVPFKYGWVSVRHHEHPDVYSPLVAAMTDALALGYRRFLDFEELEENLRLVARDKLIERIRAEALSMRGSDDMLDVIVLMFQEVQNLGIDAPICSVRFVNEEKKRIIGYTAMVTPHKYGVSWTNPRLVELSKDIATMTSESLLDSSWDKEMKQWRSGEMWTEIRTVEEDLEETRDLWAYCGFDAPLPIIGPEWPITGVPFQYGWVNVRHRGYAPEHLNIIQELTAALSLGYVRYLDFQRLEEQNKALEENLRLLRETQNQLVMQEKMASLGDLVSGVAHEMNTPIGAAKSMHDTLVRATEKLCQILATEHPESLGEAGKVQSMLSVMDDANKVVSVGIERASDIVGSLRNFARLDEAEFQTVDLHEGLDSSLALLQSQLGEQITVSRIYGDIAPIYCSPGQLNQVFMHLLKNAIAATDGSGEIKITTSGAEGLVIIRIQDSGRGIPEDQLERIFDFDFQAAGKRMKMGFGLAADYRIIQDHQGEIQIDSDVGRGTEVTIALPLRTGME